MHHCISQPNESIYRDGVDQQYQLLLQDGSPEHRRQSYKPSTYIVKLTFKLVFAVEIEFEWTHPAWLKLRFLVSTSSSDGGFQLPKICQTQTHRSRPAFAIKPARLLVATAICVIPAVSAIYHWRPPIHPECIVAREATQNKRPNFGSNRVDFFRQSGVRLDPAQFSRKSNGPKCTA